MTVGTCHTIADAATNRESFYVAPIHYEGPERRAAGRSWRRQPMLMRAPGGIRTPQPSDP